MTAAHKMRMFCLSFSVLCAAMIGLTVSAPAARAEPEAPKVVVSAQAQVPAVKGQDVLVGLVQTIIPNWHTYWINPGDSGEEMKVQWTLPDGVTAHEAMQWPVPERIAYGPLMNFGYKDRAVVLARLSVADTYTADTIEATARVTWLVCEEICIPEESTLTLSIPVIEASASGEPLLPMPADTPFFAQAKSAIPAVSQWSATFAAVENGIEYRITVPQDVTIPLSAPAQIDFFPVDYGLTDHATPQDVRLIAQDGQLVLRLGKGDRAIEKFDRHRFILTIGEESYDLTATPAPDSAAVVTPAAPFDSSADPIQRPATPTEDGILESTTKGGERKIWAPAPPDAAPHYVDASLPAMDGGSGLWDMQVFKYIALAFLGGIVLNLMPCVFPVLSMKALSIVKLSQGSRLNIWAHGLTYTAGILSSFAIIAFALLSLRAAGENVGWGFQLQDPNVIIGLSWLLFAVGLNLSGVFDISIGRASGVGEGLTRKPGLIGTFFTGMLATIVATPCTAPFMGAAFGAAVVLPQTQGLTIFLALGFGLAFPYLLLCFVPFLTRMLPRPGAWMDTFKQFLAFPMYASAIWLVWVVVKQTGDIGLLFALGGMLILAFGIWILRHNVGKGSKRLIFALIAALCILGVLAALIWMPKMANTASFGAVQSMTASSAGEPSNGVANGVANGVEGAQIFSHEALAIALTTTDRPVFVNMTAAWCITCLLNERTTLSSPAVTDWMAAHNVLYLKGDWTNRDAHITDYLKGFGRNGVPIYVFYGAPQDGHRPTPIVLPQILSESTVKKLIP